VGEALLVYAIVAAAAVWTVWKVMLPRGLKARLLGKGAKARGDGGCGKCGRS
jgi:hypothetical protein